MTVTRLNEFQAAPGKGDALREKLASVVPAIRSSAGCVSCQLLQSVEDPTLLIVIEVWESVEAHRASAVAIPPPEIEETMALLAGLPEGEYFTPVD